VNSFCSVREMKHALKALMDEYDVFIVSAAIAGTAKPSLVSLVKCQFNSHGVVGGEEGLILQIK
jgi:hypothetical protein